MPYNLTVDNEYNRSIVNHLANDRARQSGYFVPSNIQPNHLFNPARDGEEVRVRAIKMEGGSSALPTRRYLGSGKKGRKKGGAITPLPYQAPFAPAYPDPKYIGMIHKDKVGGWNLLNGNSVIAGLGRKKGKKGGYYLNDTTRKGGWNLLNGNSVTLI